MKHQVEILQGDRDTEEGSKGGAGAQRCIIQSLQVLVVRGGMRKSVCHPLALAERAVAHWHLALPSIRGDTITVGVVCGRGRILVVV